MIWNKYTIKTTTKDADMVSATLMDFGITDIQIENNIQLTDEELNQMYADFVKELPPDDGTCFINFYMEFDDADAHKAKVELEKVWEGLKEAEEMFGLDPLEFDTETVDSCDWENNWKEYFKPFYVDDIAIKPTWETMPEDSKYSTVINIDPGMAFGTGMHETTRLCLRGIRKFLHMCDYVIDLGCGSGILSIAALKLGAEYARAIDIDPQATEIARENFEVNGIKPDEFEIFTGNILTDKDLQEKLAGEKAELVVANILAEIIEPLVGIVDRFMADNGIFISSGILDTKEQLIVDAVNKNPNLELVETEHDGDWVRVVAKKVIK